MDYNIDFMMSFFSEMLELNYKKKEMIQFNAKNRKIIEIMKRLIPIYNRLMKNDNITLESLIEQFPNRSQTTKIDSKMEFPQMESSRIDPPKIEMQQMESSRTEPPKVEPPKETQPIVDEVGDFYVKKLTEESLEKFNKFKEKYWYTTQLKDCDSDSSDTDMDFEDTCLADPKKYCTI